jgi:hypothetical protein
LHDLLTLFPRIFFFVYCIIIIIIVSSGLPIEEDIGDGVGLASAEACAIEEEQIYICSSRLGLIKMDPCYFGNGRTSQQ